MTPETRKKWLEVFTPIGDELQKDYLEAHGSQRRGPPVEDKDEDEEDDLNLLGRGHKEDQSTLFHCQCTFIDELEILAQFSVELDAGAGAS